MGILEQYNKNGLARTLEMVFEKSRRHKRRLKGNDDV